MSMPPVLSRASALRRPFTARAVYGSLWSGKSAAASVDEAASFVRGDDEAGSFVNGLHTDSSTALGALTSVSSDSGSVPFSIMVVSVNWEVEGGGRRLTV